MIESLVASIAHIFSLIPFTGATWFVIMFLGFFIVLFARASKDTQSPVKWEHLIIDSSNDRASPYKVGYLVGLVVSTWIIINFSDNGKLTYDIFGMYLTYLLGGAGWNSFVKSKDQLQPTRVEDKPVQKTIIAKPLDVDNITIDPSGKLM